MSIIDQFSGAADTVRQNVHAYRHSAVEKARRRVQQAAKAMAAARNPLGTLVNATGRFNDLSHETVAQLVRQNGATLESLIDGGIERLKDLAQAEDLKSFIRKQVELTPAVRDRVASDLGQLWSIARHTGRELGTLASDTYAELVYGVPTRAAPARNRKPTRRATKKAVRTRKAH
jgi:phasin family protein